jgi:hypothetical protein
MTRIALAGLVFASAAFQGLSAQSIVFVSPSTKGRVTMSCAAGSLNSFEELHFLAAAHYLAEHLCSLPNIDGGVGLWKGQAENSGMIDGCANDKARELGALLAKYYQQKAALVFDRDPNGKTTLVSFRATRPIGIISAMMARAGVSGATLIPRAHDSLILIVATDSAQRAKATTLYSLLHARDLHQEPGNTELIGDHSDRVKARDIYTNLLSQAPADVRELGDEMYSEKFSELGMQATPSNE